MLDDIREYFSRHFLGHIRVRTFSLKLPSLQVSSLRRVIETHPVRTQMQVSSAVLFPVGGIACSSSGFRFAAELVRVYGSRIRRYALDSIVVHKIPLLRAKVHADTGRMHVFPQERQNRLSWQMHRPKTQGEMVLAWYGPLIDKAIVKMALNKQRGTLFIWYNPQSRHFQPRGLYLCRRLGAREKPEWRWV